MRKPLLDYTRLMMEKEKLEKRITHLKKFESLRPEEVEELRAAEARIEGVDAELSELTAHHEGLDALHAAQEQLKL